MKKILIILALAIGVSCQNIVWGRLHFTYTFVCEELQNEYTDLFVKSVSKDEYHGILNITCNRTYVFPPVVAHFNNFPTE